MPIPEPFQLESATPADLPLLLELIRELAEYEHLANLMTATIDGLHAALFGPKRVASAVIARAEGVAVGFALYFFNFSTFLGKRGLYLEDLYVKPESRRRGIGRALLAHVANIAVAEECGRMEWSVLDWNETALRVYRAAGASPLDDWTIYRLTGDALTALAATAPGALRPTDR